MYRVAYSRWWNGREWKEKALPVYSASNYAHDLWHGAIESQSLANISIAKSPFLDTVQPFRGRCIPVWQFCTKGHGKFSCTSKSNQNLVEILTVQYLPCFIRILSNNHLEILLRVVTSAQHQCLRYMYWPISV